MAITKVFERLYLSDVHDADRLSVSNPLAITAVVNVSMETNQHRRDEIKYVHFPWDETEKIPTHRFEQVITAISQLVRTRNVLVHCIAGSSRSPVIVALYMHILGYKNFDDALSELRSLRPVVAPSALVIERAKAYLEGI
jgi:protein-tyrosine phosphatase